jgi:hypothetical protein
MDLICVVDRPIASLLAPRDPAKRSEALLQRKVRTAPK